MRRCAEMKIAVCASLPAKWNMNVEARHEIVISGGFLLAQCKDTRLFREGANQIIFNVFSVNLIKAKQMVSCNFSLLKFMNLNSKSQVLTRVFTFFTCEKFTWHYKQFLLKYSICPFFSRLGSFLFFLGTVECSTLTTHFSRTSADILTLRKQQVCGSV